MEAKQEGKGSMGMVAVAAFAAFLATFNETYLNVAFAPIMADFAIDANTVQWIATAYMLGAAVMVPVSAFAFKSVRVRPLFCATTVFLIVGSVIGALAPSFPVLLIGRIVQAFGTGMLIPIGMNITLMCAPREKLGACMGVMGAMTTLGPSISIIAAGAILSVCPWNVLLWVFAGLSALCFLFGAVMLRNVNKLTHPHLDVLSVALIGLALLGILYGVSSAFMGTLTVAAGFVVLGIIFLVLFVRRQGKLAEPLIDLRPLSTSVFSLGVVANMLSLLTIFAMNILVPTFLQSVLGVESLAASLALFPAILLSCVIAPVAGRIYDTYGAHILLPLGFALIAVFTVAVSLVIGTGSIVAIAALYIPVICGSALIIGPVQSLALSSLPPQQNPHGVTLMSTGFQIAGCIGSSVFMGVYGAVLGAGMASGTTIIDAASNGFLMAGILVAVCAVAGFAVSFAINRSVASRAAQKTEEQAETAMAADSLTHLMKRDVYTLSPMDTVRQALLLFSEKGISGAPVMNEGVPVGFISDGDVMRFLANQTTSFKTVYSFIAEQENSDFTASAERVLGLNVGDVCTGHVISVDIEDDLGEVCHVLAEHHLKKAPVLDGGKMVGIINRSNVTNYAVRSFLN